MTDRKNAIENFDETWEHFKDCVEKIDDNTQFPMLLQRLFRAYVNGATNAVMLLENFRCTPEGTASEQSKEQHFDELLEGLIQMMWRRPELYPGDFDPDTAPKPLLWDLRVAAADARAQRDREQSAHQLRIDALVYGLSGVGLSKSAIEALNPARVLKAMDWMLSETKT